MNENEVVFLQRQFDLVAVTILFGFYFRLNISASKLSDLLIGDRGGWSL